MQGEHLLLEGLRRLVGTKYLQVHFGNESLIEQVDAAQADIDRSNLRFGGRFACFITLS